MKTCSKCSVENDISLFGKDSKRKDGLNPWCRECCASYYTTNRKRIREQSKEYRKRTAHLQKERSKIYVAKYAPKKVIYDVTYRKENVDKIREYKRAWEQKNKSNPIYKIKRNLRRRIHHVIVDGYKSAPSVELLGCSIKEFKTYLESLFLPGMSWDNYGLGGWHIDHIRPCCDFDLKKESEQRLCFNFRNCQPLWEADNLRKAYISEGKNCRIKD